MNPRIRILLCDDHPLLREGLRAILREHPGFEVVGEAKNGLEAVSQFKTLRPDVALMDIDMPELSGLEATKRIVEARLPGKVLILSLYDDEDLIAGCLDAGAAGYVLKDGPTSELLFAIEAAHRGERYMSPRALSVVIEHAREGGDKTGTRYDLLTDREREVLRRLADGHSSKDIALTLNLSIKTVEAHKYNLMRKLDIHNRADLVKYAIRKKLVHVGALVLSFGASLVSGAIQPSQPARIEEMSGAVTWIGSWSTNALPANSGGGARLAMEKGTEARLDFVGTSVAWIGYRDEWSGLADVLLDGELQATIDTFAKPAQAQATLFQAHGLREGRHTLTIRPKGNHQKDSAGSWVWVDAFIVGETREDPPPFDRSVSGSRRDRLGNSAESEPRSSDPDRRMASRRETGPARIQLDQEDKAVTWEGSWSTNRLPVHRGRSARLAMDSTSSVSLTFTGTGVSWIGYRDEWSGIAEVLLDGKLRATVDTYSPAARGQVELYTIDGLRDESHTLTIQPTSRRSPKSGGAWIWVDGFLIAR